MRGKSLEANACRAISWIGSVAWERDAGSMQAEVSVISKARMARWRPCAGGSPRAAKSGGRSAHLFPVYWRRAQLATGSPAPSSSTREGLYRDQDETLAPPTVARNQSRRRLCDRRRRSGLRQTRCTARRRRRASRRHAARLSRSQRSAKLIPASALARAPARRLSTHRRHIVHLGIGWR